jgi:transposase-like protein
MIIFVPQKQVSMEHYQTIRCPHCSEADLQKNGKCSNGVQRWYCKGCKKFFRLDYSYNAYKPGMKEKIIDMTLNSSGVRDIGRVLRISKDTVCAVLKKNSQYEPLFSYKRGK